MTKFTEQTMRTEIVTSSTPTYRGGGGGGGGCWRVGSPLLSSEKLKNAVYDYLLYLVGTTYTNLFALYLAAEQCTIIIDYTF